MRNFIPLLAVLSVVSLVTSFIFEAMLEMWAPLFAGYLLVLLLTAMTIVLRSNKTSGDGLMFGYRALWPPAIMGIVGVMQFFGVVGTAFGVILYIIAWLLIVVWLFLSAADLMARVFVAIRYSSMPDVLGKVTSGGSLRETIWSILDKLYVEPRPITLNLPPGVKVLMEVYESMWTAVYEKMIKRGVSAFGAGLVLGIGLVMLIVIVEGPMLGLQGIAAGKLFIPWQLIFLGPILTLAPVLTYTYYVESWNRLHHKFIFTLGPSLFVAVHAPDPVPVILTGSTAQISAVRGVRPGKTSDKAPIMERVFDAISYWLSGTQELEFLTTIFGTYASIAADESESMRQGLEALLSEARAFDRLSSIAKDSDARAKLSEKLREIGAEPLHAVEQLPGQALEAFNQLVVELYGAEAQTVSVWNVFEHPDGKSPIFWDRKAKAKVAQVGPLAQASTAGNMAGFAQRGS